MQPVSLLRQTPVQINEHPKQKGENPALVLPLKIKGLHNADAFSGAFLLGACYALTALKAPLTRRSTATSPKLLT